MPDTRLRSDLSQHAVARWDTLVRTTVLLGVRPSEAPRLAARAVAAASGSAATDGWAVDPDVSLFAALLDAHRDDRRRWWSEPSSAEDLETRVALTAVERELDLLAPGPRARVVLGAVALLPDEQLDQIVLEGEPAPPGSPPGRPRPLPPCRSRRTTPGWREQPSGVAAVAGGSPSWPWS